ncbi:MAG: hypothetical protein LUH07_04520, partial [Lachnospiraceae bacterium]|nr:hypothetical protein [Lachnospiraceae bacterium]
GKIVPVIQQWHRGKNIVWKVVLSLLIVIAFMIIGSYKNGYHVDEMYTLGLSNHQYNGSIGPEINDGVVYTGQQLWQEYTMVSEDNRFDYGNVVENQTHDVHPPLYYAVVHTVFSFFPDTYSIYFPLIVNIVFAIIVFWQMVWLFLFFTKKQRLSVLFSLLFIFTMGFVNSVVFFRMYVLLAVWTNALIMLFCKYRPTDRGWKYYALLVLIITGGTMTQYYFTIFAFFACAVYAIRLAVEKNWKKIVLSCASVALSVGISTLIFPTMWKHIFSGYRGQEAFTNLSTNGLWASLWSYLDIINLRVFGDLFICLFFLGVALFITGSKNIKQESLKETAFDYLQLAIPAVCYILMIADIAPYKADRYVMNVMGILFLLVFATLIKMAYCYSKQATAGIVAIALIVIFCSYKEGIPYLYTSESENVATIENLDDDVPCLYLYDSTWKILPNYLEMANLNEIVFIKNSNLEILGDDAYENYGKVLVYIISTIDSDQVINQLLDQNSELSSSTKLFSSGYATAYYLE